MSRVLSDGDEELYRQVNPAMMGEDGLPSRSAFTPTKKDDGQLSTLRQRIGPEEAYRRHVAAGLKSRGTWSCTVDEVIGAGGQAVDDGEDIAVPDHASIDLRSLGGRGPQEKAARKLRDAAVKRGCRYQPTE